MKALVNGLSIFRIVAAFAIVPLLLYQFYFTTLVVFALAGISDFFDGWLAKKYNVVTKLGGVLDHMGDKFLAVNALLLLMMFLQIWLVIIPVVLMIARELYVSGLREFLGTQKMDMPVPSARMSMGKIKTTLQLVSIGVLLLWIYVINAGYTHPFLTRWLLFIGIGGLWLSLVASLWSATQYTRVFMTKLKSIK